MRTNASAAGHALKCAPNGRYGIPLADRAEDPDLVTRHPGHARKTLEGYRLKKVADVMKKSGKLGA